MKILYTLLLSACSLASVAQTKTSKNRVSQRVSDNDKTMQISISGDIDGRAINYDRTFDVTNLNQAEKDALKQRIADSLGLGSNINHTPAKTGGAVNVPAVPNVPNVAGAAAVPPVAPTPALPGNKSRTTQDLSTSVYDNNGTMHVQIKGYQAQKQINYHRTFNVKGWSATQKEAMVKRITDSLGVSSKTGISNH